MNELVSVYIPTHNRSKMLKRAVSSVLNQTYKNIEIIISDDGSSDDTRDVVSEMMSKHDNIIYLRSEVPKGACHARNMALEVATGFYLTGLDDDDEFKDGRIEELLNIFKGKNNYSFISSGILRIEKKNVAYSYIRPRVITNEMIKNANCVGNQIFTKTSYMREIGGFDESLKAWQDYDCWFRMIMKHGAAYNCGIFNYVMHTEHDEKRITTSSKAEEALDYFTQKHILHLKRKNIKNIKFNFILYYTVDSKLKALISYFTIHNMMLYLRFNVKIITSLFRRCLQ